MTEREICYRYRRAQNKAQHIQILAELNGTNSLNIIEILVDNEEELPESIVKKMCKKLESLEVQIREKEREYAEILQVLRGGK